MKPRRWRTMLIIAHGIWLIGAILQFVCMPFVIMTMAFANLAFVLACSWKERDIADERVKDAIEQRDAYWWGQMLKAAAEYDRQINEEEQQDERREDEQGDPRSEAQAEADQPS